MSSAVWMLMNKIIFLHICLRAVNLRLRTFNLCQSKRWRLVLDSTLRLHLPDLWNSRGLDSLESKIHRIASLDRAESETWTAWQLVPRTWLMTFSKDFNELCCILNPFYKPSTATFTHCLCVDEIVSVTLDTLDKNLHKMICTYFSKDNNTSPFWSKDNASWTTFLLIAA